MLGGRAACDKPHDPAIAPGDTDPLPGSLRCEQSRPHHPPTLARGVIVEALREQLTAGFPPRLNVDRGQLPSVIEEWHDHLEAPGCHSARSHAAAPRLIARPAIRATNP
jgi:hypothetical protein